MYKASTSPNDVVVKMGDVSRPRTGQRPGALQPQPNLKTSPLVVVQFALETLSQAQSEDGRKGSKTKSGFACLC